MRHFREVLAQTLQQAQDRQKTNPNDGEALLALTLAAGMESDALSILETKHLEGSKRMKEANKYAKQLLAQDPDLRRARHCKLQYRIAARWFPASRTGLVEFTAAKHPRQASKK
jgi:hypothetical protein